MGRLRHDAISALAALTRLHPAPRTSVRLPGSVAAQMVGEDRDRYAEALREAAEVGVLSTGPEQTAWYGAPISSDTQASRAEELVDQLRDEILPQLRRAGARAGGELGLREPATLVQLGERLALLDRVQALLGTFQSAVFAAPLPDLVAATADKRWREERGVEMGFRARRRLKKEAAALQRPAALSPDLHRDLGEARDVVEEWRRHAAEAEGSPSRPSLPEDLEQIHRIAARSQKVLDELAVLLDGTAGADLAPTSTTERRVEALAADRADLETSAARKLLRRLGFDGLGERRGPPCPPRPDRPGRRRAGAGLWRSVLELIAGAEPTISQ